jgi:hypothetical protein
MTFRPTWGKAAEGLKRKTILLPVQENWVDVIGQMAKDAGVCKTKLIRMLIAKYAIKKHYDLPKDLIGTRMEKPKTKAAKLRYQRKMAQRRWRAKKRAELMEGPKVEWFWLPGGIVGSADLDSLGVTAGMVDEFGVWHPDSHRYTSQQVAKACRNALIKGDVDGERWELFVRRYGQEVK